ncbi:serine/threonine-protein kinase Pink1, mitochondrial-like [Paramacrobiotus metropolitanus]|uniref:serine/threonine-protein kinase Pink1, mitochondrial-like n=1 Tax=Paramacrobiotus metropolitanus TaxID=2943436 RepID=UPI00244647E4|nr:serine/threonine-protein kinase Pink1, mitochondrial-like [Paramacrobiotus metropolitanus]
MSLRQAIAGFHHGLLRVRAGAHLRRQIGNVAKETPLQEARDLARLRGHSAPLTEASPVHATRLLSFPRSLRDLVQGVLAMTPALLGRNRVATIAGRFTVVRPGRTLAPLMGFIAAMLRESQTPEFRTQAACVAVRDEAHKFSKSAMEIVKPHFDLSSFNKISDLDFGRPLGKGCNAAVYEARLKEASEAARYDLAVKVLFNYSVHSDADNVERLFESELLPSQLNHLNIIDVFKACVDEMPALPQCEKLFPSALPRQLHQQGLGRTQTMFVLMNKYSCTLRDMIECGGCSFKEGLAIFAQLLEGVAKLVKENVVHRDIKSDNILLRKSEDGQMLRAVISDFGCSLRSLRLHYTTSRISRGGNRALMPPEVINAQPGLLSIIDYSRADLWSIGTIAYEIFAGYNPFFEGEVKLNSASYDEAALPDLDDEPLNNLIQAILRRDPYKRPSPAVAATACQMLLWDFPLDEMGVEGPRVETVRVWIMQLCVQLICGCRGNALKRALLATFLKRCNVTEIVQAGQVLIGQR